MALSLALTPAVAAAQTPQANAAKSWNTQGDAAYNRSDWNEAIEDYSKAIELDPSDGAISAQYFNNRGAAYRKRTPGEYVNSLPDFEAAHRLDPTNTALTNNLAAVVNERGVVKYNTHDYSGALADFQAAHQLDAADQNILLNIRNAQNALNPAPAPEVAQNNPATPAGQAKSWNTQGDAAYNRSDWNEAIEDYSKAIELDPSDRAISAQYFNNRGAAYRKRTPDEYVNSLLDFEAAHRLDPTNTALTNNLAAAINERGVFKHKTSDFPGALADYQLAHDLNPADAVISGNLEHALNNRGVDKYNAHDYSGALADFQAAHQLDAADQTILLNIRNAQNALNPAPTPEVAQNNAPPPAPPPPPQAPPVSIHCKVEVAKAFFNLGLGAVALATGHQPPQPTDVDESACDGQ